MHKILEFLKKCGYKILPTTNRSRYVYKETELIIPQFEIPIEEEIQSDDMYVYGWVIQENYRHIRTDKKDHWSQHWKRKIYTSKSSAIEAVNQYRLYSGSADNLRIKPLYSFINNGWRNYLISKIIDEK